jgi:hypothetical protein
MCQGFNSFRHIHTHIYIYICRASVFLWSCPYCLSFKAAILFIAVLHLLRETFWPWQLNMFPDPLSFFILNLYLGWTLLLFSSFLFSCSLHPILISYYLIDIDRKIQLSSDNSNILLGWWVDSFFHHVFKLSPTLFSHHRYKI